MFPFIPISEWGDLNFPTSLVDLTLYGEPNVRNFSQLSNLFPSALTKLEIVRFDNLESLSTGLQHLTSLQHLDIWNCPKVNDLPEMLLPSLLSLRIIQCPKLKERCEGRGSHYWPLISHIPEIDWRIFWVMEHSQFRQKSQPMNERFWQRVILKKMV
ncbi:putative leucine-rich repeat domain superfamily [Helianthus anomalus]